MTRGDGDTRKKRRIWKQSPGELRPDLELRSGGLLLVEPLPGESIAHFLGRFRRRNALSKHLLGRETGLGFVVSRWEKFYFNPFPTDKELEALGKFAGLATKCLQEMLPDRQRRFLLRPTRLCAACYTESACHKTEWQYALTDCCAAHSLKLLSTCPVCRRQLLPPSQWEFGNCNTCLLSFTRMAERQGACTFTLDTLSH